MGIRIKVGVDYVRAGMDNLKKDLGGIGTIAAGSAGGMLIATAATEVFHKGVDVLKDSINEAINTQAMYAVSAQNLKNAGLGGATKAVKEWSEANALSTGFTKSEIVPAFDRMVRSTHSVKEAIGATTLAENIARATHKDLGTVTAALGKTYDGNKVALGRLGLGHDAAIIKAKGLKAGLAAMNKEFSGSAKVYADSAAGLRDRFGTAVSQVKDQIGTSLMGVMDKMVKSFGIAGLKSAEFGQKLKAVGLGISAFIAGMGALVAGMVGTISGAIAFAAKGIGALMSIMQASSAALSHLPIVGKVWGAAHDAISKAHNAVTGFGNATWDLAGKSMNVASALGKQASALGKQAQSAWNAKVANDSLAGSLDGTSVTGGGGGSGGASKKKGVAGAAKSATDAINAMQTAIKSAADGALKSLADKFQAAADKAKGLFDQVRGLFNLGSVQQGTDIVATMSGSVAQSNAFNAAIKALKAKGLNKQSLSELLAAGPSSLAAAQNLLSQGPGAIAQVNHLEGMLLKSANTYAGANYGNTDGAGYGSSVTSLQNKANQVAGTHYDFRNAKFTFQFPPGTSSATQAQITAMVNAAFKELSKGRPVNKNVSVRN